MYIAVSLIVVLLLCSECATQSRIGNICGDIPCSQCYRKLVDNTITDEENQLNMQKAFFPAETSSPVYVVVHYNSEGHQSKTFFWSESTYFALFHPLPIYQYTSLFFGDYDFRTSVLNLALSPECYETPDHNLSFFTVCTSLDPIHIRGITLINCEY